MSEAIDRVRQLLVTGTKITPQEADKLLLEIHNEVPELMGVTETAQKLGISTTWLQKLNQRGYLKPAVQLAHGKVYSAAAVRKFAKVYRREVGQPLSERKGLK